MPSVEEPPTPTAESIAQEHFSQELKHHQDETKYTKCNTVVIVHDACYGHKFARPKTKDTIRYIFERPERIQAGVMGISAAYVRLGERHAGGRSAPHPRRDASSHLPFRIVRTSRRIPLSSDAVTAVHGKEWMKELQGMCDTTVHKLSSTGNELARAPTLAGKVKEPFHSGDLYLSKESIDAFEGALGGVCEAVDAVFQTRDLGTGPKQAFVCVRPPGHHCSADWPSGFCWLNNVHVGIQHAVQTYGLTHAAIIDFDLHHGDGSQDIAWDHNERMAFPKNKNFANSKKSFIGYFSLHDIDSFPCEFGDREKTQMASLCVDNAHGQAIWNVHLKHWSTPEEFWQLYETRYRILIEKTRSFLRHRTSELQIGKGQPKPKAAIFISAGFDASEHETQGMQRHPVNVMTEFYARFTREIVQLAREEGTSVEGRVVSVLEGGYSDKALVSGILSHISGLCEGDSIGLDQSAPAEHVSSNAANVGISGLTPLQISDVPATRPMKYNPEWWHDASLDTLTQLLRPVEPEPEKTSRTPRVSTFSSPTASSVMKKVDPSKVLNRSTSFSSRSPSTAASRAASPPPPDVDWAIAASELCKLLIPRDRDIKSHTMEYLNPKEIKVKKERIATVPPPARTATAAVGGRTLRDRKARNSVAHEIAPQLNQRKVSADRRRTIAEMTPANPNIEPKETRRRLSAVSNLSSASTVPSARQRAAAKAPTATVDIPKARTSTSTGRPGAAKPIVARSASGTVKRETTPRSPSIGTQPKPDVAGGDADVDILTAGLKRITIKVPSNEEYASRSKRSSPAPGNTSSVRQGTLTTGNTSATTSKSTSTVRSERTATNVVKKPPVPSRTKPMAPNPSSAAASRDPVVRPVPPLSQAPEFGVVKPSQQQSAPAVSGVTAPVDQWQAALHQTFSPNPRQLVKPPGDGALPISAESSTSASTSPHEQGYPNLQWQPLNADVSSKTITATPAIATEYPNGVEWATPNKDTGS